KGLSKAEMRDATTTVGFGGLGEGIRRKAAENIYHPAQARMQSVLAAAAKNPNLQKAARALQEGARRGIQGIASTDYILQQTDPAYREFVEFATITEAQ